MLQLFCSLEGRTAVSQSEGRRFESQHPQTTCQSSVWQGTKPNVASDACVKVCEAEKNGD